jgi:hypothetical protein
MVERSFVMTYEEIKEKYPIGKLLYRTVTKEKRMAYWASAHDRKVYRTKYPDAEFADNGTVTYTETLIYEKRVEGWLYDGEDFFIAENTWDGWIPLDEDDLAEYEARGIVSFPAEF